MIRPVRSRLEGIFKVQDFADDSTNCGRNSIFKKRRKRIKPKKKQSSSTVAIKEVKKKTQPVITLNSNSIKQEQSILNDKRFMQKLEDERFSEFTSKDWTKYFKVKAKEHGVTYKCGNGIKENGVMVGLINDFTPHEIKDMIDFLWDCEHEMFAGKPLGVYMLASNYAQNDIYQNSLLWKQDKFKTQSQIKREQARGVQRNRNWIAEEEDKPKGVTIRI